MVAHYLTTITFRLMMCLYISTISTFVIKFPTSVTTDQQLTKLMIRIIRLILIAVLILVASRLEAKPAELVFTYWGSPFERQAVKKVLQQFNRQHANVRVRAQHIPNSNYTTKLVTMVALVPHLTSPIFQTRWFQSGLVPAGWWIYRIISRTTQKPVIGCGRAIIKSKIKLLVPIAATKSYFFTKQVFDQAGLAYPPATAEEAWSWEEFVAICQKL